MWCNVEVTPRPYRFALVLTVCAVMTGCAGPSGPVLPQATYAGPLTTPAGYDNGTVMLAVPSPTRFAAVPWSDAYAVNCRSGDAVCDLSRGPTIVLAEATVTTAGHPRPDGSLEPLVKDALVYVLEWTDVPCGPVGPAPSPGSTAAPQPDATCTLITLIDAGTGRVLLSVEGTDI
jgi:hypothetical protein